MLKKFTSCHVLPGEVFQARPAGKRLWGRPRTRWRDYISTRAWERQSVLVDGAREREVLGSLLERLLPQPDQPLKIRLDQMRWVCSLILLSSNNLSGQFCSFVATMFFLHQICLHGALHKWVVCYRNWTKRTRTLSISQAEVLTIGPNESCWE